MNKKIDQVERKLVGEGNLIRGEIPWRERNHQTFGERHHDKDQGGNEQFKIPFALKENLNGNGYENQTGNHPKGMEQGQKRNDIKKTDRKQQPDNRGPTGILLWENQGCGNEPENELYGAERQRDGGMIYEFHRYTTGNKNDKQCSENGQDIGSPVPEKEE